MPHNAAHAAVSWPICWLHFTGTQVAAFYAYLLENVPTGSVTVLLTDERFKLVEAFFSQLTFLATPAANQPAQPSVAGVAHSIQFMREHLASAFTVTELAAQADLSVSYYSALFRAQTGRSPIVFFNFLKVQEACQQLSYSKLRIKEIASHLGFTDGYYFTCVFTKLMGLSPRPFRQAERA